MEFIDLGRQYDRVKEEMDRAINEVVQERHFIMGPQVQELEERLAEYVGRKYCLSCSSGTSALYIPMAAMELKDNDAVFVPSFTYFASAETVALAGAVPVFVDSDETYNMDPEDLERAIKDVIAEGKLNPRLIMTVDLFGLCSDYDRILEIADKYQMQVITDDAQAFAASYKGKQSCSFGDVSATSFFPAKPLGCYGDGGAIFTDDKDLYDKMHSIRVHGQGSDKYDNVRIGINGRLDTIQAAVLLVKLDIIDDEVEKKNELRLAYDKALYGYFKTPIIPEGRITSLAQYTILTESESERKFLMEGLKKEGIPSMIYYQRPMHIQTAFKDLGYKEDDLPVCLDQSRRVMSLPMHAYMTEQEFEHITKSLIGLAEAWKREKDEYLD